MAAIDLGSVMGPQGPQGSIWYQGTAITGTSTTAAVFSESEIEDARVYDKYFNTATNDVYTCIVAGDASTAKWAWIGNLRGAQGNIGPVGPTGSVDMNTPIEFTEAETRANIESGESVSTIFGKLKKVVGDLLAGSASTLLGQKLTASRALIADADGNVGVSGITSTELGYLDGVTGNIQGQIGDLTQLQTTDKSSIVAAVNEQNVKMNSVVQSSVNTPYGTLIFITNGKIQSVYGYLKTMPTDTSTLELGKITENIPINYAIISVFRSVIPYEEIGSMWIYANGNVTINKPTSTTACYVYGTYIIA